MIGISDISQRFSADIGFLVLCCRIHLGTAHPDELCRYVTSSNLNWQQILRLASHHGVRPLIYKVVSGGSGCIDPGFMQKLRGQSLRVARDNMEHLREIVAITSFFQERGIPIVPYKGVLLGHLLFDDYALRENSDLDMLIMPEDFPAARKLFIELGYSNTQYYNEEFEDYFIRTNREFKFQKLTRGNKKIKVELQWNPLHKLMGIPLTNRQLFMDLEEVAISGTDLMRLSLSNELLLLFAHHGVADVWRKLKHILDIAAFIYKYRSQIDWPAFERSLIDSKLQKFAVAGCQMSELLFGIETPIFKSTDLRTGDELLDETLSFPLLSTEKTDMKHLRRHLSLCATATDKLGLISRYVQLWLMPNMRDIKMIKLPKPLFPLYFIVRRFRFLQSVPPGK